MSGGRKNIRAAERTELLAPACDKEGLIAVFHAGADAVYLGGEQFGARAYANNFSKEDLLWSLDYAHIHGKKICLAVNTLLKDKELWGQLYDYIEPFYEAGLDAVIVQDYGVLSFLKKHFPGLALHASTQMTVTDLSGALYLKEQGVSRVVLARELSAEEIREIKEVSQMEIEVFIHGALCYCYSGQCLLSSMIGGRSGNRGRCAQPCRLSYQILTGKSQKGTYPLSLKDLCTVEQLPTLLEMEVDSLKIEGRMKRPEYAAGVTEIYRKYMDRYFREEFSSGDKIEPKDREQLLALGNRGGFTKGYLFCQNGREMITQGTASFSAPSGETIDQEMKEKHIGKQLKEPVTGYFLAKVGEEIQLTVTNQEHAVTVKGGIQYSNLMAARIKGKTWGFIGDQPEIGISGGLSHPEQVGMYQGVGAPEPTSEDMVNPQRIDKDVNTGVKGSFHKMEWAIPLGVSYEYKNVVLDVRYMIGLSKVPRHSREDRVHNSCTSITLGVRL